jgi:hypothetical protein
MRKKIHTLTASENPKASEIYNSVAIFEALSASRVLATCVAANAKNRKRKVPTNSPKQEMNMWRTLLGSQLKPGRRFSSMDSCRRSDVGWMRRVHND